MCVHLGLPLQGYFSNKHQQSTQAPHVSSVPLSLVQLSSSAVQPDFETTKEEKSAHTNIRPARTEMGHKHHEKSVPMRSQQSHNFMLLLTFPTHSMEYAVMLTKGADTSPPCLWCLEQAGVSLCANTGSPC